MKLTTQDSRILAALERNSQSGTTATDCLNSELFFVDMALTYRVRNDDCLLLILALLLDARGQLLVFLRSNSNLLGVHNQCYAILAAFALNDTPLLDYIHKAFPDHVEPGTYHEHQDFEAALYDWLMGVLVHSDSRPSDLLLKYSSRVETIEGIVALIAKAIFEGNNEAFDEYTLKYMKKARASRSSGPDTKLIMLPPHGMYNIGRHLESKAISSWDCEIGLPWDADLHRVTREPVCMQTLLAEFCEREGDSGAKEHFEKYEQVLAEYGIVLK